MKPARVPGHGRASGRGGFSAAATAFIMAAVAALGLAAAMITQSRAVSTAGTGDGSAAYYAALSGLEWASQVTAEYTTADRAGYMALDGTVMEYAGAGGPSFALGVAYSDPDSDPATEDTATIVSTGYPGAGGPGDTSRVVRITRPVPPPSQAALFEDHHDQPTTAFFDGNYQFGAATAPHGGGAPYTTAASATGGDMGGYFTLPEEPGGTPSVLEVSGAPEARYYISASSCLKWNALGSGDPCAYAGCASAPGCQARKGMGVAMDAAGYHNYFVKMRVRLVQGTGFGVYFRASYAGEGDPNNVDFAALSAYVWQYDTGLGYIAPCDMTTAVFGSDGSGTLAARKINAGSETCAGECGLYGAAGPGGYPFFCPENRTGLPELDGWQWTGPEWYASWRVVYLYVYRGTAKVYVEREEAGTGPELVGVIDLESLGTPLKTGGVGFRAFGGAGVQIDYVRIYPNDEDHDPSTFSGSP